MPPDPLILAFDTSAAHCAAALLSGNALLGEKLEEMNKGQAERLFPLLEELLKSAGASWHDLTRIGVGIGPGNFTGTRISVSAARGLALSLGIPAIGVSSFEALAFDMPRPVLACVDGRAGRIYAQAFEARSMGEPVTLGKDELPLDLLAEGGAVVGFGAEELAGRIGATPHEPRKPMAQAIARIAATRHHGEQDRPAPLYMRPADAAPPRDPAPVILS